MMKSTVLDLAIEGVMWYNEGLNIVVSGSAGNTPDRIRSRRERIMDTISSCPQDGNTPHYVSDQPIWYCKPGLDPVEAEFIRYYKPNNPKGGARIWIYPSTGQSYMMWVKNLSRVSPRNNPRYTPNQAIWYHAGGKKVPAIFLRYFHGSIQIQLTASLPPVAYFTGNPQNVDLEMISPRNEQEVQG